MITAETHAICVKQLQDCLRTISQHNPGIPRVAVDGIFGHDTVNAVLSFQKEYGLESTGIANKETWDAIHREADRLRKRNAPALPVNLFYPANRTIKLGDTNNLVLIIQILMQSLGNRFLNFKSIKLSGNYDTQTAEAITTFQNIFDIKPTGCVDKATWNMIVIMYNHTKHK